MLQDISPHALNNQYEPRSPLASDYLVCMRDSKILLCEHEGSLMLPEYGAVCEHGASPSSELISLLSVDGRGLFYLADEVAEGKGFAYHDNRELMSLNAPWASFAAATALHLAHWYQTHVYCGSCATPLVHSNTERALCCPACGLVEYPRIAPVVIVGITHGDKILLTKNAHGRYRRYALVAGFIEIGETAEEAALREVNEEVGLTIKNLRYYKSQPWAFSQSLLLGFFAELDGNPTVHLNDGELSEATWVHRDDIPTDGNTLSLTWTMIEAFRTGTCVL